MGKKTTGGSKKGKNSDPPKNLEKASTDPSKANATRANIYYNKKEKNRLFEDDGSFLSEYWTSTYLNDIPGDKLSTWGHDLVEDTILERARHTGDPELNKACLEDNSIYYNLIK